MSSPTDKIVSSSDTDNDSELNLADKKYYLPLAVAGGLGGICNTGIRFITPHENDILPNLELSIGFEFLIYLFFSIIISSILAPAFAIFLVGWGNIKNFNRLLIISMLSGVFLTFTIDATQKVLFSSKEIKQLKQEKIVLQDQVNKKEKQAEETEKITEQVIDKLDNIKSTGQPINLDILELKAYTLYEFAKVSNEKKGSSINELRKIKQQIEQIDTNKVSGTKNKIDKLIENIDNYIAKLQEKEKLKDLEEKLKNWIYNSDINLPKSK